MSYITCETPAFLDSFFAKFDHIFNRWEPQQYFRLYGTGLLLEIKRKNVQAIDSHIIGGNYQGLMESHGSPKATPVCSTTTLSPMLLVLKCH